MNIRGTILNHLTSLNHYFIDTDTITCFVPCQRRLIQVRCLNPHLRTPIDFAWNFNSSHLLHSKVGSLFGPKGFFFGFFSEASWSHSSIKRLAAFLNILQENAGGGCHLHELNHKWRLTVVDENCWDVELSAKKLRLENIRLQSIQR